ncbi:hypothetical protein LCGC14_0406900 [marine sediment metagenome]|uniref:Uncharacterized protein n=1 Tax=marine sediment metagenome TaxID=412755 RepID=A0A0F9SV28_9ZZZZ
MSWQPILKQNEYLDKQLTVKIRRKSLTLYIPSKIMKKIGIKFNGYFCLPHRWISNIESENRHKMLLQFSNKPIDHSRKIFGGAVSIPRMKVKEYLPEQNNITFHIHALCENGNVLIDLRDIRNLGDLNKDNGNNGGEEDG